MPAGRFHDAPPPSSHSTNRIRKCDAKLRTTSRSASQYQTLPLACQNARHIASTLSRHRAANPTAAVASLTWFDPLGGFESADADERTAAAAPPLAPAPGIRQKNCGRHQLARKYPPFGPGHPHNTSHPPHPFGEMGCLDTDERTVAAAPPLAPAPRTYPRKVDRHLSE
jgi:hypothetical protein